MIISVDFDGVIAENADWPAIGKIMPHAVPSIARLREAGHYVIINTCRSGDDLTKAKNWMRARGITYDAINENHPAMIKQFGNDSRKIFADMYIDDRNLGGFPGWSHISMLWLFRKGAMGCESSITLLKTAIKKAADYFHYDEETILKHTRIREIVDIRYMLYHYGRNVLNLTYPVIARVMGFDHASVMRGCRECEILQETNKPFRLKFGKLMQYLNHESNIEV